MTENKMDYDWHGKQKLEHPVAHIRFKGVWDMQDLYEFMADYFRERKYKFYEAIYKHKHPSPYGVERQYVWHAEVDWDDVYTFHINTYIHTYDAHDIEVKTKEGKVKTFTKGRICLPPSWQGSAAAKPSAQPSGV